MRNLICIQFAMLLGMTATMNVWGEETATGAPGTTDPSPQTSPMQSWQADDRGNDWTWFGMGYESRRSFTDAKGGTATHDSYMAATSVWCAPVTKNSSTASM